MAKKWIIKFSTLLLVVALIAGASGWESARAAGDSVYPQPTYGTAVVDGLFNEWDLVNDLFTELREAGKVNKPVLASAYLRYDCINQVMYILVLAGEGFEIETSKDNSFVKLGNNNKLVDGYSSNFKWINSGGKTIGWEASFKLDDKSYDNINIHTMIKNGRTARNTDGNMKLKLLCWDYGDLPAGYNATLKSDEGARHRIGSHYLGTLIDREVDGVENVYALGDDQAQSDDEDGVMINPEEAWVPGAQVHLRVWVTGGGCKLVGWFDWNRDNVFAETGPNSEKAEWAVSEGENFLTLTIPASYTTGRSLYARFRLYPPTDNSQECDKGYKGDVIDGEVEDYKWEFSQTAVNLASFAAASTGGSLPAGWALTLGAAFLVGLVAAGRKMRF